MKNFKMQLFRVLLVLILVLGVTHSAMPTVIIGPTSATTTMGEFNPLWTELSNVYDQSGLSIGYTSGVTDFNEYIGKNPTHDSAPQFDWVSSQVAGLVDFDLGSTFNIDRTAIWNFGGLLRYTTQSLRIISSLDPAFSVGVVDHGIKNLGIFSSPNPVQVFLSGPTAARYVRFTDFVSNGADETALGEVAFSASTVLEPNIIALMGLGLVVIGYRRDRGKRAAEEN